jgi:hypothetical protein
MPCLLALVLLAAEGVTADAVLRTEGRAFNSTTRGRAATALQIDASLGVTARLGEWSLSAAYVPRLLETPPPEGSGLSGLHGVQLGMDYRASATGRMFLRESLSFGRNDFSPLVANTGAGPPPVLDPRLPVKLLLAFISSSTSLGLEQSLSQRLRFSGTLDYLIIGGSDRVAQNYIPLQRGPQLAANLSWSAARRDALSLALLGSYAKFTNGAAVRLATLQAGWRHDLGRDLRTDLGLGAGFGESTGPGASVPSSAFPSLSGSITRIAPFRGGHTSAGLRANVTPVVDRLTGQIYELGEGRAELGWGMDRLLNLGASGSLGRALSGTAQRGVQLARAEGFVSFPLGTWAVLSLGARGAWQRVPNSPAAAVLGFEWAVFSFLSIGAHGSM